MIMNKELVQFAAGNTDFYEAAMSYFCDKKQTSENKALMNDAWFAELECKSGVTRAGNENGAFENNPMVKWVK